MLGGSGLPLREQVRSYRLARCRVGGNLLARGVARWFRSAASRTSSLLPVGAVSGRRQLVGERGVLGESGLTLREQVRSYRLVRCWVGGNLLARGVTRCFRSAASRTSSLLPVGAVSGRRQLVGERGCSVVQVCRFANKFAPTGWRGVG